MKAGLLGLDGGFWPADSGRLILWGEGGGLVGWIQAPDQMEYGRDDIQITMCEGGNMQTAKQMYLVSIFTGRIYNTCDIMKL